MMMRYGSLAVFLLLVVVAAAFGGSFEAGTWYYTMYKPSWTPPTWAFGPAWAVLYVLMAVAIWNVWLTRDHRRLGALAWWLLQLLLNAAWSWLFFGIHRSGWALLEMTLLIGTVILCIKAFSTVSRAASWLMVPYLLWLLYAWALNFAIWSMNGGGLNRLTSLFGSS